MTKETKQSEQILNGKNVKGTKKEKDRENSQRQTIKHNFKFKQLEYKRTNIMYQTCCKNNKTERERNQIQTNRKMQQITVSGQEQRQKKDRKKMYTVQKREERQKIVNDKWKDKQER